MPSLKVVGPIGPPRAVPVYRQVTTIGRSHRNDLVLEDDSVGDCHLQLVFDGRDFTVHRVDDHPHFFINGKKRKRSKLLHNDRLQVGATELVFSIFDETTAPSGDSEAASDAVRVAAMQKLVAFAGALAVAEDVGQQLQVLVDAVLELTMGKKAFVILLEDGAPRITVGRDATGAALSEDVAQLSDSILSQTLKEKAPLLVSDAINDTLFRSSHSVMNLQLSSVICAPLIAQGQVLGLLYVGNNQVTHLFDERSLGLVTMFSTQAALVLQGALLRDELRKDRDEWATLLEGHTSGRMLGTSPAMETLLGHIDKLASADVSVLIEGETGTGKELVAQELHRRSARAKGPFVAVNCGAIPEHLMESELFGHVRGAFTGATQTTAGKFEAAQGGTLFLDEVAEMAPALQVKLLRVLQEREVTKVGATKATPVDIRVVSATHQDLQQAIRDGRFREDLYYRLRVVALATPPLRERGSDVVLLAKVFLRRFGKELESAARGFSEAALKAIELHPWPGNIRELENRIRKAVALAGRPLLEPDDLDLGGEAVEILPLADAKEDFQRRYILQVLERNDGNRTQTARDLGVDPRTIFRYLERDTSRD